MSDHDAKKCFTEGPMCKRCSWLVLKLSEFDERGWPEWRIDLWCLRTGFIWGFSLGIQEAAQSRLLWVLLALAAWLTAIRRVVDVLR